MGWATAKLNKVTKLSEKMDLKRIRLDQSARKREHTRLAERIATVDAAVLTRSEPRTGERSPSTFRQFDLTLTLSLW